MERNLANIDTLVDVVLDWNQKCPNRTIYTFLKGNQQPDRRTFADILVSSRNIAGVIRQYAKPGDRVLVNKYPGIDYVEAIFGCFFAGVIAVPVYPPRFGQKLERLKSIIENCTPTLALAEEGLFKQDKTINNLPWITDIKEQKASPCQSPASVDDVVLLQYTSGSTSSPKGVMITQKNLLANLEAIARLMKVDDRDINVSWLPPYHDMGLMGSILETFYSGMHSILMSPFAFIQKPIRWLQAIDEYKATVSGGPNFAFNLLNERIRPEQMEGIDLRSLSLIYCGAEPIRRHVLDRFVKKFSSYGVRENALVSCYGLAEATLIVASSSRQNPLLFLETNIRDLEGKRKLETTNKKDQTDTKLLVSCGNTAPLHKIKIVDPHSGQENPQGEVGEIWFSGPSVAIGYWNLPEESKKVFNAKIKGDDTNYMRTGDFGLIYQGNLYITGRIKDMVILKGRNLYPQDIEQTVEASHDYLRTSGCAAFSIEGKDEEKLVIVQEIDRNKGRNKDELDFDEIFTAINKRVFEFHGVSPHAISLVRCNTIPVTSSGKIQRYLSKKYFLGNQLDELKRMESY